MSLLFIIVISVVVISFVVITTIRLRNKSKELSERIKHIPSYIEKSNNEQSRDVFSKSNENRFVDIPTDLKNQFHGKIISATQEKIFTNHYLPYFQEICSSVRRLEIFHITPSDSVLRFIRDLKLLVNLLNNIMTRQ